MELEVCSVLIHTPLLPCVCTVRLPNSWELHPVLIGPRWSLVGPTVYVSQLLSVAHKKLTNIDYKVESLLPFQGLYGSFPMYCMHRKIDERIHIYYWPLISKRSVRMEIHYQHSVSWLALPSRPQFTSDANYFHTQEGYLTFLFSINCKQKRLVKIADLLQLRLL